MATSCFFSSATGGSTAVPAVLWGSLSVPALSAEAMATMFHFRSRFRTAVSRAANSESLEERMVSWSLDRSAASRCELTSSA